MQIIYKFKKKKQITNELERNLAKYDTENAKLKLLQLTGDLLNTKF